jgi:hypothetical protein
MIRLLGLSTLIIVLVDFLLIVFAVLLGKVTPSTFVLWQEKIFWASFIVAVVALLYFLFAFSKSYTSGEDKRAEWKKSRNWSISLFLILCFPLSVGFYLLATLDTRCGSHVWGDFICEPGPPPAFVPASKGPYSQ